MNVRYGFPGWVRDTLGDVGPAEVMRHFERFGIELSDQQWSRLLRNEVASVKLSLWTAICEATGLPLSRFIEYLPTGEGRPAMPPRKQKARMAPAATAPKRQRPSALEVYGVER
jgi:hypothetical protein